jgi:hypothetical protein
MVSTSASDKTLTLTILANITGILQNTLSGGTCKCSGSQEQQFRLGDPEPPPPPPIPDPCDACKDAPCKDVPAGELHILVCDGKTMKPFKGTAEGQYLCWDNTNKKWFASNV